jgi:DNA-binding response OmpR family regulator
MRKRVLLVEDDAELLELLRLSFRGAGFSIATAGNGIEALEKAHSFTPDLIVLDLVLPELDGFAVCETLRRRPSLSGVPIIALTGLSSELARLAVLEAGADDYVAKPAAPRDVLVKIRRWLRSGRPAPAARAPRKAAASRLLMRVE